MEVSAEEHEKNALGETKPADMENNDCYLGSDFERLPEVCIRHILSYLNGLELLAMQTITKDIYLATRSLGKNRYRTFMLNDQLLQVACNKEATAQAAIATLLRGFGKYVQNLTVDYDSFYNKQSRHQRKQRHNLVDPNILELLPRNCPNLVQLHLLGPVEHLTIESVEANKARHRYFAITARIYQTLIEYAAQSNHQLTHLTLALHNNATTGAVYALKSFRNMFANLEHLEIVLNYPTVEDGRILASLCKLTSLIVRMDTSCNRLAYHPTNNGLYTLLAGLAERNIVTNLLIFNHHTMALPLHLFAGMTNLVTLHLGTIEITQTRGAMYMSELRLLPKSLRHFSITNNVHCDFIEFGIQLKQLNTLAIKIDPDVILSNFMEYEFDHLRSLNLTVEISYQNGPLDQWMTDFSSVFSDNSCLTELVLQCSQNIPDFFNYRCPTFRVYDIGFFICMPKLRKLSIFGFHWSNIWLNILMSPVVKLELVEFSFVRAPSTVVRPPGSELDRSALLTLLRLADTSLRRVELRGFEELAAIYDEIEATATMIKLVC